jgi:GntR family transcriptional regulator
MTGQVDWARRLRLEPAAAVPLYHQLRERLRAAARDCEPDAALPSEKEIMRLAGVSRATARRAIADLAQEGLLVARQGRGTFTAPRRVEAVLGRRPAGFTEAMRRLGRTPSTRVLLAETVRADAGLADRLQVPEGAGVHLVERLRLVDGEPAMVERAHLPADLVPGLLDHDLGGSLYDLLQLRFGLAPAHGSESIVAVNADQRMARLLLVPAGAALLATARSTRTASDRELEYTIRHARGDRCSFFVELRDAASMLSDRTLADPPLSALGTTVAS